MAIHNKLTEGKFRAIKMLLQSGATLAEAADYMQVSMKTVRLVKAAESWEEYLAANAARVLAAKNKRHAQAEKAIPAADIVNKVNNTPETPEKVLSEIRHTVTVQATYNMIQEMKKTNELLTLISNKLAFIVDELTK